MRIAIAASGRLGTTVLRPLLDSTHDVVAVIQDGRQTRGAKRWITRLLSRFLGGRENMLKLAARHRIPIFYIDKMSEAELDPLRKLNVDILLVSGFAIILKKPILELPRIGCVNMHSSLLPRHRGPNPFSAVIVQGETESGVTFHVMEEGIDTGDILDQTPFDLGPRDEMMAVYRKACVIAGERVVPLMDRIAREGLIGRPQDPALATYDRKLTDADAWLDWTRPAEELDRMVRGFSPATMPRFAFRKDTVYVARSKIVENTTGAAPGTVVRARRPVRIATGDGLLELQVAFCKRPFPWIWPTRLNRPVDGERLNTP